MLHVPYTVWGYLNVTKSNLNATNGTNSSLEYEPYLYLEDHFSLMVLSAMLLALSAIVGTLGNFLIIFAVCLVKSLRTTGNVFVVNLAVADMVVTMFVDPMNTVGVVAGRAVLMHDSNLCEWVSAFCAPACMSSLWNMLAIAVNRYVLICKPHLYPKIFTLRNTLLMCLSTWILAHLLHSPNHLGWGHNMFNTDYYLCSLDLVFHPYAIFFVMTCVILPLICVLTAYALIFKRVRSVKVQLRQHIKSKEAAATEIEVAGEKKAKRPKKSGFSPDDVKLAKTLFAAFLVFFFCWLPLVILILANQPKSVPGWIYTVSMVMAHGNSAVNPILYGCANEKFREGYRNVLGCSRQILPESSKAQTRKTMTSQQSSA